MNEGHVSNENRESVLTFDIYNEPVARKIALREANRLLRKNMTGIIEIHHPNKDVSRIHIRQEIYKI